MAEEKWSPWFRDTEDVLDNYDVIPDEGLDTARVEELREKYGWNELDKEESKPLWKLVLEQFDDLLVKILLAAAVVSFGLAFLEDGEEEGITAFVEPFVILLILILNAIVGVWQESNAENALEALKELQSEHATCIRNGKMIHELPARELVPGDIVEVHVGDRVPADMRLLELLTTTVRVEQSALTGESVTILKHVHPVEDEDTDIPGKKNMLFSGTSMANGHCRAVVTHIGMSTEIGKIQNAVQSAAEEEEDTPLKKKLDEFGEMLSKVIAIVCLLVWVINYKNFFDPMHGNAFKGCIYYLKIAVALAVAAIPEGLPAVITTCLALGTRKMAQKNAIVRKLPSVETLGCTTVICSDKTGTLTTNQMSVVALAFPGASGMVEAEGKIGEGGIGGRSFVVSGVSFDPSDGTVQGVAALDPALSEFATVCSLCNDSKIMLKDDKFVCNGAPTEAALCVLVEKLGVPDPQAQAAIDSARETDAGGAAMAAAKFWESKYSKLATLEFTRTRKSMSVICNTVPEGTVPKNVLLVKGAPESVLDRCTKMMLPDGSVVSLEEEDRAVIAKHVASMAEDALRVLAFAKKSNLGELSEYTGGEHPAHTMLEDPDNFVNVEADLTFLGLAGMQDPPRPEVATSIASCNQAGIRVIVITGDNQRTAEAIARAIGVFGPEEDVTGKSYTGREFMALSPQQRKQVLSGTGGRVFSRSEPQHKQDIVRMLRDQGEVVAMTGDGVNDAPALKLADIGIAMGIAGTEVAKQASDMVLADDNFSTIVSAVEEGRSIYNNMKAFIRYLISSNIGEVASIFFTAALGMPEGLIPVQLLWVNLVTDGPPATALGFNPADLDIMRKPPRRSDDVLINGWVFFRYMVVGLYVGFATVGIFAYWYMFYEASGDGHTLITFTQLTTWTKCSAWTDFQVANFDGLDLSGENACNYFTSGKIKPCTLSLSVLVTIEMLNALNALSEDGSLLSMPPWCNPWLLVAMALSFGLHFVILYVPMLAEIFSIAPLDWNEWLLVLAFSFPVIIIDEVLKAMGRVMSAAERKKRLALAE